MVDFISYTPEQLAASLALLRDRTDQYCLRQHRLGLSQAPDSSSDHGGDATRATPSGPTPGPRSTASGCWNAEGRDRGLPYTIVRPSHTYGRGWLPLAFGSSDFTIAARMLAGKEVIVHGDGQSLWTLTHARDFAAGLVGLLGHPGALGEAVQIMGDEALTWDAIHRTVAARPGGGAADRPCAIGLHRRG